MTVHAKLGASSADRWMKCPGSLRLSQDMPNTSSIYAQEGTAAHSLAERCLRRGMDPAVFEGTTIEGVVVTEDMVEAVGVYVDAVRGVYEYDERDSFLYIEHRFDLKSFNPPGPMFGTADAVVWSAHPRHLHVFDLKYGQGHAVSARGNPQLRYYGLGALVSLLGGDTPSRRVIPERITLTIVQPRANHPEGIIRSEELTLDDLLAFAQELMAHAHAAVEEDAPLALGDHCRFCRAMPICPEQKKHAVALARTEFDTMPMTMPPLPETLTDDELHMVMEKMDIVQDWLKSIRQHVQGKLERGEDFPGYKVVEKRAVRKWAVGDTDVEDFARDAGMDPSDVYEPKKLRSVAGVERLLKKVKVKLPADLVMKTSSGYTLAPDADPRAAQAVGPANEFDALPAAADSTFNAGVNEENDA